MKNPAETTTPDKLPEECVPFECAVLLREYAALIEDGKVESVLVSIGTKDNLKSLVAGQWSGIKEGLIHLIEQVDASKKEAV
jgi:hypothetical protein